MLHSIIKIFQMLFLPVEIKAREFKPKLSIAALGCRFNLRSLIGREDLIDLVAKNSTNGVFFAKIAKIGLFKKLKANRHRIVWLDEEAGLLFGNPKLFLANRLPPESVDLIDHFCFWSRSQLSAFCEIYPECANRATLTGHPRHDIRSVRSKDESRSSPVRLTYFSNSHLTALQKTRLIKDLAFAARKAQRETLIYVRPHPIEDATQWVEALNAQETIKLLDAQRPSYEDLTNSDLVVHSGSTTAIDSAFIGKVSLKYIPKYLETNYCNDLADVADEVSLTIHSRDALASFLENEAWIDNKSKDLKKILEKLGFRTDAKSTETIVNIVVDNMARLQKSTDLDLRRTAIDIITNEPLEGLKTVLRNTQTFGKIGGWRKLHEQCSEMTPIEIESELSELGRRFSVKPAFAKVYPNLFLVSPPPT